MGIDVALSLILDGEMLVYDPELDRYMPFGQLKTAALGEY
jgi:ATP-dependent DNA ligase